jgi:hypothetical protein
MHTDRSRAARPLPRLGRKGRVAALLRAHHLGQQVLRERAGAQRHEQPARKPAQLDRGQRRHTATMLGSDGRGVATSQARAARRRPRLPLSLLLFFDLKSPRHRRESCSVRRPGSARVVAKHGPLFARCFRLNTWLPSLVLYRRHKLSVTRSAAPGTPPSSKK